MHERNQRLLCRLGFVLVCFVPTTVTAACIAVRATPWYAAVAREEFEKNLEAALGVGVLLGEVEEVGPRAWLLKAVELSDPETNARIARITTIDASLVSGDRGETVLDLKLSQPQVSGKQLPRLWSTLERRLLRGESSLPGSVHVWVGELTIEGAASGQTFTDFQCLVAYEKTGRSAWCRFRLPSAPEDQYVELSARRRRDEGEAFSEITFDTGGAAIPCSEIAAWAPRLVDLGPQCRFRGAFHLADSRDGWRGELRGELSDIDFNRVITERFPHKLSGMGSVVVNRAALEGGRLTEASGVVDAREGEISASLLAACQEWLGWEAGERMDLREARNPTFAYRQLAFEFDISPAGLAITGLCAAKEAGVVCLDVAGPLLYDAGEQKSPTASLARVLSRENEFLVPATAETNALLHLLPSAPMESERTQVAERAGYSRVRMKR